MGERRFLDSVYEMDGPAATQAFYADWADSYDAEVEANGYASPRRCAEALANAAEDLAAPLLDLGCGTGLSGVAFRAAGFTTVDGSDFSPRMLAAAERKGVYRRLLPGDLNDPAPAQPGDYVNVAAVGVFSPSHAPAGLIHQAMALLPPGGCFVYTLNDHALADWSYEGAMREIVDSGSASLVFKEHGDHLPKIDLRATVVVLRKS
ncbi:MAG: methyltransferase domain-containing protein [Pseudomonadota bacterium]